MNCCGLRRNWPAALTGARTRFLKPTVGFEPTTTGLQNRCPKGTSSENTKTCETSDTPLTPQRTHGRPKQDEIAALELPPDLAEMVTVWSGLPEHIKAAIRTLVQTHIREV